MATINDRIPRITRCRLTRAGEQLRVRVPAGSQVPDLKTQAERIAAFLGVREVRVVRDPASPRYARVVVLRRDPLADPTPVPWPLVKANRLSLWQPVPVGVDEDGSEITVTLPERNLLLGGEPGAGKSNVLQLLVAVAAPARSRTWPLPSTRATSCWSASPPTRAPRRRAGALRVRHLNLLRGRCEVSESATEVDGRLAWGPTKTYAHRTAHLPRFLCEQLAAYLTERPHGPDDLAFTAPHGGPLREQKFVAGIFKPAAVRAGLFVTRHLQPGTDREVVSSDLRFHDLRHTCASLLIAQGASVKAVQAQLGHASATVTLDRYGHLFPDELQQLVDRLRDAYAQATTDPARTEGSPTMLRDSKEAGR